VTAAIDAVEVCAALADESRWRILQLVGEEPLSASELAERLPITRQAIARHLQVLADAGLVEPERAGKQLRYRALGGRLSELARQLDTIGRGWDRRLAAIKAIAES
jgi:DNA-binding transcriptional ArsR family regulator